MPAIHLAVNGRSYTVDTDSQTSLLIVLRDHLDLTGSKYGCGQGEFAARFQLLLEVAENGRLLNRMFSALLQVVSSVYASRETGYS